MPEPPLATKDEEVEGKMGELMVREEKAGDDGSRPVPWGFQHRLNRIRVGPRGARAVGANSFSPRDLVQLIGAPAEASPARSGVINSWIHPHIPSELRSLGGESPGANSPGRGGVIPQYAGDAQGIPPARKPVNPRSATSVNFDLPRVDIRNAALAPEMFRMASAK